MKVTRGLLRQEVEELTELLRSDPAWKDLRDSLAVKKLSPLEVLLAGYHEDEFGHEYGAVVTFGGEIFDFKRRNLPGSKRGFMRWKAIAKPADLLDSYAAIEVAVTMLPKSGHKQRKGTST